MVTDLRTVPSGGRTPPHSDEAEASVLGAILLRPDAMNVASELLVPEDFYVPRHRDVYEAMLALSERGSAIDPVTLEEELRRLDKLQRSGGVAYLAELSSRVPTAENVRHYAQIVRDKATARALVLSAGEIVARGYGDYGDVQEYLDESEQRIFEIRDRAHVKSYEPIKGLLKEVFKAVEKRSAHKGELTGVPSGFGELDGMTAGLQPSDLVIIAARPSMGKTAFALSIAQNAALAHNQPVIVFSLEMSALQLMDRLVCSEARIDSQAWRRGNLQSNDWRSLATATARLSKAPVVIDDSPSPTVLEVRGKCRRFRASRDYFAPRARGEGEAPEPPIGLVVIDYLQLMRGRAHLDSREREISEISRGLKALAKELKMPVIALSQLNRSVESRTDKRPQLSDLRESGAIEQDADVIMFIYRDEFYAKEKSEKKGIAEIIIGKQRNGPIGTAELAFLPQYTRFENLARRGDEF